MARRRLVRRKRPVRKKTAVKPPRPVKTPRRTSQDALRDVGRCGLANSCPSRSETEPFSRPNRATGAVAAWSHGGMLWGSDG